MLLLPCHSGRHAARAEGSGALSQPPLSQEVANTLATKMHVYPASTFSSVARGLRFSGSAPCPGLCPCWAPWAVGSQDASGQGSPGAGTDRTIGKGGRSNLVTAALLQAPRWASGVVLLLSGPQFTASNGAVIIAPLWGRL